MSIRAAVLATLTFIGAVAGGFGLIWLGAEFPRTAAILLSGSAIGVLIGVWYGLYLTFKEQE